LPYGDSLSELDLKIFFTALVSCVFSAYFWTVYLGDLRLFGWANCYSVSFYGGKKTILFPRFAE